jgi:hypothetical protein
MSSESADDGAQREAKDFRQLPPRVKPEEMVESHPIEELNLTGAPAGDPDTEFIRRYPG